MKRAKIVVRVAPKVKDEKQKVIKKMAYELAELKIQNKKLLSRLMDLSSENYFLKNDAMGRR